MMRLQVPHYALLSQADTLKYSFSGTGVNVTAALSHFGHKGSIVTVLPNNALGDAAQAYLQKLGISPSFIMRSGKYMGMYFLENGFGVRPSRVTYTNRMESSFNTADRKLYHFEDIAKQIDVVHFCGITLAMNDRVRQQMKDFAKAVRKNGGTVVFDCNYRPSLWGEDGHHQAKTHYEDMLYLANIVMMNEKDARLTLNLNTDKTKREEQLKDLIPTVVQKYNIATVAGTHRTVNENNTHSLRGFIFRDGTFYFSEELTFPVLDRIGAGDAYTSGIIHGELTGLSPDETVRFAAAASMHAHTVVGDTPWATESDISRVLSGHIRDVQR